MVEYVVVFHTDPREKFGMAGVEVVDGRGVYRELEAAALVSGRRNEQQIRWTGNGGIIFEVRKNPTPKNSIGEPLGVPERDVVTGVYQRHFASQRQ